jgi:hypothetical protein
MVRVGVLLPAWTEQDDHRFTVRQVLRLWEFQDHGVLDPRELASEPEPDDMPTRFDPEAAGLVRVA